MSGVSPSKILLDKRYIGFQNYKRCDLAFNEGYEIKFSEELGVPYETLEEFQFQRIILARHQIIHALPLIGILNEDRLTKEEQVFFKYAKQYAKHSIDVLDGFIILNTQQLGRDPTIGCYK